MCSSLISCPLCSQPAFANADSLRLALVSVSTRHLMCPICAELLLGLDKLTIHMFGHLHGLVVDTTITEEVRMPSKSHQTCKKSSKTDLKTTISNGGTGKNENKKQSAFNLNTDTPKVQQSKKVKKPNKKITPNVPNDCDIFTADCIWMDASNSDNIPIRNRSSSPQLPDCLLPPIEGANKHENIVGSDEPDWMKTFNTKPLQNLPSKILPLHCEFCGFKFTEEVHLQMHRNLVHSKILEQTDTNSLFPCHLCSKKFQKRGSLMVHFRVVHYGFPNRIQQQQDQIRGAEPVAAPSVTCSVCSKVFLKQQQLASHMKTHENKQWECDVCSKMFTTKYFLKKHKRLHTGEMPYHCSQCNKAFTFQQSYHKHILYHSSEKPHICSQCGRSFKELSTLHNHERIHSGERPFSCETCGKCFRQRVSCLVHRRIHTGAMPYQCTACGKNFRYKVSQRTHKCPSQPPGTVVRQDGGLLQKILNNSHERVHSPSSQTSLTVVLDDTTSSTSEPAIVVGQTTTNDFPSGDPPTESHAPEGIVDFQSAADENSEAVDVIKNTDFFSLVMSPMSLPSPTDKLQKLCLSSVEDEVTDFAVGYNDLRTDALETINEESLKQLLYGSAGTP